ncbi:MAG: response regulator transcription factor [Thalassobaculales bacterium]
MPADAGKPAGCLVALVDDDALFRESLALNLESGGMRVVEFADGASALAGLPAAAPDLVILDWRMPGMTGLAVLKALREDGFAPPALFLTSLDDPVHEEAALGLGAVDYVEKSRGFQVLARRIALALSRRPAGGAAPPSGLELDRDSRRARWNGQELPLTLNEFAILAHLVDHAGRDVPYRDLYAHVRAPGFAVGAGEEGYRQNVRTFLKRIRQKFRDIDPGFDRIGNYAGFGYRWKA